MNATSELEQGRAACDRLSWAEAFSDLVAADNREPLGAEDLELLSTAALLSGQDAQGFALMQRTHNAFLGRGDLERAALWAVRLGMWLLNAGQAAQAGGWLGRAGRLLDDGRRDCVESGYLQAAIAMQSLGTRDLAGADAAFTHALEIGERFGDADLLALSRLGHGSSLIARGEIEAGAALHDEIMVSVTSGEVSPAIAGIAYCVVIENCREVFDLRRAQEWTSALTRWCESQPGLVAFRGNCLIFRTEIMQLHGRWADAITEAERARDLLLKPPPKPFAGAAFYELAELHRLRGEFAQAEEGYRQASHMGHGPMPGLALMRFAQGHPDQAATVIRRERDEATGPAARAAVLTAFVDLMVATGDLDSARIGVAELAEIAAHIKAPILNAIASQARGAVLLAEGDPRAALQPLRRSASLWRELEAPYEGARVRVLIARACRALGDSETSAMELEAARRTFKELGALPDLAAIDTRPAATSGLSEREVEVLRLVAAGSSNRAIALRLVISEKTVARHVSNIFTKLGLSNRAAATAYAYEHGLR
ncbi:DNA-binding response regulator [bacterium]|nr:MAG: DNA-binding response regulator [bacterium]